MLSEPVIIGVTGMIAGGKSHTSRAIESLGAWRVDADAIARDQLDAPEVRSSLIDRFGDHIATGHSIDRQALAAMVFEDSEAGRKNLKVLESLVHPRVRRQIARDITRNLNTRRLPVVLDVPLLIESKWHLVCDEVLVCVCRPEVQQDRAAARGWTKSELSRRTARQMPVDEKIRHATLVVDTTPGHSPRGDELAIGGDLSTVGVIERHFGLRGIRFGRCEDSGNPPHCDGRGFVNNGG